MTSRIHHALARCALSLAALGLAAAAHAQTFPDKPVRIVVPFGAGGGIDGAARLVANGLAQQLGQTVIVDNRPGGNSVIGASAVATSPADGYTLLFTSGSTVAVLPHISKSLPFDPAKDFVPVGKIVKMAFFLVAPPATEAKNVQEFLALARAQPGKLTYGSAGAGTGAHLGFELLKQATGIDVTHVPYKATAQALPDLLSGRIHAMMADPNTIRLPVGDGSLRALGATTKDRSPLYPDIPSIAEQGVAGFDLELWMALFAPAGTPPAVVQRINEALRAFLKSPQASEGVAKAGFTIDYSTPEDLGKLVRADSDRWAALARTGALKAE